MIRSENLVGYTATAVPLSPDSLQRSEEEILRMAETILRNRVARLSDIMSNPSQVGQWLCHRIGSNLVESLGVLFLDNQHRVIAVEELFTGAATACTVSPAHIIRRCIHHNAQAILVYHNHPSGIPEPSEADFKLTEKLVAALQPLDITVLDHLVVSSTEYASLREKRGHIFR